MTTVDTRPVAAEEFPRLGPFEAFRYGNYRLIWTGMIGSSAAIWMESLAFGWLVLELTGSPFLLGIAGFCRAVPQMFFSIWGGVLADRLNKRKMLMTGQITSLLLIILLAALITFGQIQVWQVFVIALLVGTAQSFNIPARQSIVSDAVPQHVLPNAIALNSLAFNVSRVTGPSIGGIVVAFAGTQGVFWLEAFVLLLVIATTLRLNIPESVHELNQASPIDDLKEAFGYVAHDRTVRSLLLLLAVPVVLAFPYQQMIPVFARDTLGTGPDGLGFLMSAAGVGAVLMLIGLVFLGDFKHKSAVQLGGVISMSIALIAFAQARTLWVAIPLLMVLTASSISYNVLNQTLVQSYVPPEVRGRVLGIYQLIMGMMPIGGLVAGAVTDIVGAPATLTAMGLITLVASVLVIWRNPALRRES